MPFPQTKKEVENFINNDKNIKKFASLLVAHGMGMISPKSSQLTTDSFIDQPLDVKDYLANTIFYNNPYIWKCNCSSSESWNWSYDHKEINREIHFQTIKLSHILNKLAEFNDQQLELEFIKKVAEQFGENIEKTRKSLQDFHMFVKTPTISKSQSDAVDYIEKEFARKYFSKEYPHLEVSFYSESFILSPEKCFVYGSPDLTCVVYDKKKEETYLFLIEFDGFTKTSKRIEQREARFKSMIGKEGVIIDNKSCKGEVIGIEFICSADKKELSDNFLSALNNYAQGTSRPSQVEKKNKIGKEVSESVSSSESVLAKYTCLRQLVEKYPLPNF